MRSNKLSILALAALLMGAAQAQAAVITVDSTLDVVADDGVCTCREAVENANSDSDNGRTSLGECAAGSGDDVIVLPAGTITLANASATMAVTANLTISGQGKGTSIIDGNKANRTDRVFNSLAPLVVSDLTIQNSDSAGMGGAVAGASSLSIYRVAFLNNDAAGSGGAINASAGILVEDCEFENNTAVSQGGAIYPLGDLTVRRSYLGSNAASIGGAIYSNSAGILQIENSTFHGNQATGSNGGAIYKQNGILNLSASTIANNNAVGVSDALHIWTSTMNLAGSIFWGHASTFASTGGTVNNSGFNVIQDITVPSHISDSMVDPQLAAPAYNGGTTKSMSITASSSAFDLVTSGWLATDQRGVARPQGTFADAGAFELVLAVPPTVTALSFNSAAISGTAGLLITGTDFVAPLTVTVKGLASPSFVIHDSTSITAQVPANTAGAGRVEVTTDGGSSADVAADDFSYAAGPIVVTTTNDVVANDGECSCREATQNADSDGINGRNLPGECGGGTGADVVLLPAGTITLVSDLIANSDLTLSGTGSGSTIIDGSNSFGIGVTDASVTIQGVSLLDGRDSGALAAIYGTAGSTQTLTVLGVRISSSPFYGIFTNNAMELVVRDSSIEAAGLIGVYTNNNASIVRSSVVDSANQGLFHASSGAVTIENSTFDGNSTGLQNNAGMLTMDHSTVTNNAGAGLLLAGTGNATVSNSIFYNSGDDLYISSASTLTSNGSNIIGNPFNDGTYNTHGSDTSGDPLLQVRAANGGLGQTLGLGAGSPAIDGANAATSVTEDQRGIARPQGPGRDIGAFEVEVFDTTAPTIAFEAPAEGDYVATGTPLLWATLSDDTAVVAGSITLTANGAAQSFDFDGVGLTRTGAALLDGFYQVTLTASDAAANTGLAYVGFTVDTLTPTAAVFPADNAFTSVSASAWAQISDANIDPSSLTITVNGVDGHIYSNGSITSTAAPIEGLNAVTLTATDLAGNALVLSWVFTLDTIAPTFAETPADGVYTNVSASAWAQIVDANVDPAALTITANGVDGHLYSNGSITSTAAPIEGLNALTVTASDLAGNSASLPWVFTLDTILPSATVQAPVDLTWTANASPAIWATVSDANFNPAALTLTVNGVPGHIYSSGSISSTASGLSDGLHAVTLTATDLANNTRVLAWVFNVDTTAPTASAGSPTGLTNVATQTVTVAVSDGSGIGVVTGGLVVKLDGVNTPFSFDGTTVTLDTNVFTDGTHYVEVQPTDQLGNAGANYQFQFTVITDPTPPLALNPSPVGVTNNASPLIYAQLYDADSGVAPASVSMTVNGSPVAALADASEVSFSASALAPGVHVVTVDLKDVAGNQATQLVWQFTISSDTTAPTVGNPSPLGVTNTGSPFIYASLSDLGGSGVNPLSVSMTVDGVWVPALADASEVSYTASGLSDGTHTVTVDVADMDGNQATQFFWTFVVASDTDAPVITSGTPTGVTTNADPLITASLSDVGTGIDVASVQVSLDGVSVTAATDGVTVSYTASALSLGVHTVNVDIKDLAGNAAAQLSWSFTVVSPDQTAPVISAGTPTGLTTNADPLITAALFDAESGIDSASVVMSLDGNAVAAITDGVTVSFTAAALADGVHTVNVDAKDLAGNAASQLSWSFFVGSDPFPPVVSGASPTGVTSNPNTLIQATLVDVGSGIDVSTVVMTLDGAVVAATTDGSTVSFTASALADGVHTVEVSAKDLAGNAANQLSWSFTVAVDSIAPVITAGSPTGVTTNANTVITASFIEDGIGIDPATAVLTLNGVTQAASADGASITFTASNLADGLYIVTVDAKDLAGNTANQLVWQFTVQADVTAPGLSILFPTSADPLTVAAGAAFDVFVESSDETELASVSVHLVDYLSSVPFLSSKTIDLTGAIGPIVLTGAAQLIIPSGLGDGTYDLVAIVHDAAGNSTVALNSDAVLVDGTAPTASLGLPTGTVVDANGNTTITLQLDDATSGIDGGSVKLYLDGVLQTGALVQVNGLAASVTLTATGLSAGLHTVTVEYADLVGNAGATETWSFTMVRDNTAPVIHAILAPTGGSPAYARASGTADVSWSYTELNPVSAIVRVLSGATVIGETVISAGLASATGLTRSTAVPLLQGATEGVYDAQVELYDMAGQSHSLLSAASVVVDNQAPTASAGLPAGGSIVQTASPVVQASLADLGGSGVDLGSVVLRLDGVVRTPNTLTGALVSFNASGLADGEHTASVELRDRSGNVAQTYVWTFRTDVSTPDITLTLPSAGAYVRGTPTVEALATDAGSGVTRTAFYHGSTLIDTAWFTGTQWVTSGGALSPSASVLWDTTVLADGIYVLSARAVDLVGNTGTSSSRIVTVDNTPPVVVIDTVFSPTQYQSQTITGSVTELNLAQLRVNGILATLGGSAPNWTYTAVVPLNPGANGVTVTASDLGGNEHSVVTGISMDPTAAVHFVHPAPGSIFRATTGIEVTAPPATNTLSLEVSPDNGANWFSVATPAVASAVTTLNKNVINGWRLDWDTINDGLADGNASYQLRAVAYDQYGVQLGSAVVSGISTDNTVPAISFVTLPAPVLVGPNLEVYQPNIVNQGTVTEAGLGQVRVLVEHYNATNDHVSDSPAWLPLLGDLRFSRDERLVEGYNRIVYTVVDGAGNSASASRELWYELPQNSGQICQAGGTLATVDGTSIQVPSGALLSCADLSITRVLRSLMASPADSFLKIVGEGRQIDPVSLVFQTQAVLTLPYTDADLDPDLTGNPYNPATLRVLFWDGSLWQNKGVDSIDTVARLVTVRTNHLGLFALAADTAPIPAEPKVYLTRNPFRYGTDRPTAFVYEMPVPGRVTIKIYDKTGDLVRTLVDDLPQTEGRFTQVWDGLNNFDRFVGSGIYLFRFEAVLSNGSTKTLTKAIGVLK